MTGAPGRSAAGDEVVAGIRPEDLLIGPADGPGCRPRSRSSSIRAARSPSRRAPRRRPRCTPAPPPGRRPATGSPSPSTRGGCWSSRPGAADLPEAELRRQVCGMTRRPRPAGAAAPPGRARHRPAIAPAAAGGGVRPGPLHLPLPVRGGPVVPADGRGGALALPGVLHRRVPAGHDLHHVAAVVAGGAAERARVGADRVPDARPVPRQAVADHPAGRADHPRHGADRAGPAQLPRPDRLVQPDADAPPDRRPGAADQQLLGRLLLARHHRLPVRLPAGAVVSVGHRPDPGTGRGDARRAAGSASGGSRCRCSRPGWPPPSA